MLNRKNVAKTMVASALAFTLLAGPNYGCAENYINDSRQEVQQTSLGKKLELTSVSEMSVNEQAVKMPNTIDYFVAPLNNGTYFVWTKEPLGNIKQDDLIKQLNSQTNAFTLTKDNTYFSFGLGDCVIKKLQLDEKGNSVKMYPKIEHKSSNTYLLSDDGTELLIENEQLFYVDKDKNRTLIGSLNELGIQGYYFQNNDPLYDNFTLETGLYPIVLFIPNHIGSLTLNDDKHTYTFKSDDVRGTIFSGNYQLQNKTIEKIETEETHGPRL